MPPSDTGGQLVSVGVTQVGDEDPVRTEGRRCLDRRSPIQRSGVMHA